MWQCKDCQNVWKSYCKTISHGTIIASSEMAKPPHIKTQTQSKFSCPFFEFIGKLVNCFNHIWQVTNKEAMYVCCGATFSRVNKGYK